MDGPELLEAPALAPARCGRCGSLAEELYGRDTRTWFVRCPVCGSRTGPHLTREQALGAWEKTGAVWKEGRDACANGQS